MKYILATVTMLYFTSIAYGQLGNLIKDATKAVEKVTGKQSALSQDDIIRGLKQALEVGVKKAVDSCSQKGGFYKNSLIQIPFPKEAEKVESLVRKVGMNKQADEFVEVLNTAAEKASTKAAQLFVKAITNMTVEDGMKILKGQPNAATEYLKGQTEGELKTSFQPIISESLKQVHYTRYWQPLASKYNKMPFVDKINPDLESYVNEKAIDGIFKLVAREEALIRKDPKARITDLLKKVFK